MESIPAAAGTSGLLYSHRYTMFSNKAASNVEETGWSIEQAFIGCFPN